MNIKINKNNIFINTNRFNLQKTFECGQCFRFNKIDDDTYQGVAYNKLLTLSQKDDGVLLYGVTENEFYDTFFDYFDLGRDYDAVDMALQNDPVLCNIIPHSKGIRILNQHPFETLVSFIISASNNIPRIKKIINSLCENFGKQIDGGFAFPTPEVLSQLTTTDLAVIKAGFRDKYIIDCAKKVVSGAVDFEKIKRLDINSAREQLKAVNGVGDKVADCALLFGLGFCDSFPKDVWIKRILKEYYGTNTEKELNFYGFGGIAQQYLFYYAITEEKKQYALSKV